MDSFAIASRRLRGVLAQLFRSESNTTTSMANELETALAQAVKDEKVPHGVIAATNGSGSFTYQHATGIRVLGSQEPIKQDSVFLLASSTKLLTTIAALRVVEDGLFGLDDDVAEQLPELAAQPVLRGFDDDGEPMLETRKNAITLRHLLTHSSGTCYDGGHPALIKWQERRNHKLNEGTSIIERFLYPLVFEPGESFIYSPGLDWTSMLLERVTGQTLEDYMKEKFWTPLGLKTMTFWPDKNPELKDRIPHLTTRTPDGKLALFTDPFLNTGSVDCFGGHGMYSTMGDYLQVLHSLLVNDGKLLKPATVEMIFTPQLSPGAKKGLQAFRRSPYAALMIGDNPPEVESDWGLGGILFLEDHPDGRRKKGTLNWGGIANTFWILDREANLAFTWGTQVLPPGDEQTSQVIKTVEQRLYEMAGVKF